MGPLRNVDDVHEELRYIQAALGNISEELAGIRKELREPERRISEIRWPLWALAVVLAAYVIHHW